MATNNTNRMGGVVKLTIDGVQYKTGDSCGWDPSMVKRETANGLSGPAGYIESIIAGQIKVTLYDAFDLSVTQLMQGTDVLVQVEAANGKMVTGTDMWATDAATVSGKDGTFEMTYEGLDVRDN